MKDFEPQTKETNSRVSYRREQRAVTLGQPFTRGRGKMSDLVRGYTRLALGLDTLSWRVALEYERGCSTEQAFLPRRLGKLAVPTRFCVVGAINALVDFGVLNLLSWSWPAAHAVQLVLYNTLALVLANANSYLFNTLWTFKEQTRHESPRQRATFVAQAVLNVGVNNGLFWLTAGLLADTALSVAVAQNLAKAISTVAASTLSFLLMRYVVFGSRRGAQRSVEGAHVTSAGGEWTRTRYCLTRRPQRRRRRTKARSMRSAGLRE